MIAQVVKDTGILLLTTCMQQAVALADFLCHTPSHELIRHLANRRK